MIIETNNLPTHIAQVCRRVNFVNPDDLASHFLETSYLAEACTKTIACALVAGLTRPARDIAYRHSYGLVRADGLGIWESSIREISTPPTATYLPPDFQSLLNWISRKRTKSEDEDFRRHIAGLRSILELLGHNLSEPARAPTIRDMLATLVQIRNKTKAHGAVGEDFYAVANEPYLKAVAMLLETCPAFSWQWIHLSQRQTGKIRAISLKSLEPRHLRDHESHGLSADRPGIYFYPEQIGSAYYCGSLLRSNRECTSFSFPNGNNGNSADAEFIDYATGTTERKEILDLQTPPAPRPPSETEGLSEFDIQSNVFGNLPQLPESYIRRDRLESELFARLKDRNHPIITLHGGGGMGKTSLALFVAHQLANMPEPIFEHIIWFSARDIDLRPTGPSEVRPSVIDLQSVSQRYGQLFSLPSQSRDSATLAKALEQPNASTAKGTLFIFDNFETLADIRGLHRFLDEHTHLPNKVLITSRERAFVADFPIEVRGMEYAEAREMLIRAARDLYIEGLMDEETIQRIYDYTAGHAYVMRVVAGEMAKDGRYTPPAQLMGRREDIVNAVFERSFNKLSEAGRNVFLIVANWRAEISELGIIVVLGIRGIDAEAGIEECRRLSLVFLVETNNAAPTLSAPQLARRFGQKKLQGDSDRLVIQDDLATLRKFSSTSISIDNVDPKERLIQQFIQSCMNDIGAGADAIARGDKLLEGLAALWPDAWLSLADFRVHTNAANEKIEYALRRGVEENPNSKHAWIRRASFAEKIGDESTRIAALVSAVEAAPADLELVIDVAIELVKYINAHLVDIPKARRGVYLASVRSHMEKLENRLDPTGLSRLAWLFLLEGNTQKAREFAEKGCQLDSSNTHCRRILTRLESQT